MIIEKRWTVKFKNVKSGQVFECWGKIFIKSYNLAGEYSNIVDLSNGYSQSAPADDEEVTLYDNAKVVLI